MFRYRNLQFFVVLQVFGCYCMSFSTPSLYSKFKFAPNGVCTIPKFFSEPSQKTYFTMRNVPGDGDCLFLAVAPATAASMGLGGNDALLRAISHETRQIVASVLESEAGTLLVTGKLVVRASDLLKQAAAEMRVSTTEYLQLLRTEGRAGGLHGGGPELTVLANILRRPISIYELSTVGYSNNSELDDVQTIVCKGVFGKGAFEDPLRSNNAVLHVSTQPIGAYSWHLHILVVDASVDDKHACVLYLKSLNEPTARFWVDFGLDYSSTLILGLN